MKQAIWYRRLFIIVGVTELLSITLAWTPGQFVSKPLIMPLLFVYYYLATGQKRSSYFVLAIFFCWAGDIFLLLQAGKEIFFVGGLAAFLIGHVLYIFSYRQHQWSEANNELLPTQKIRFSFPIVLAGTGLTAILFPTLGDLQIPVLVYSIVLMLMVMTALFRFGRTNAKSFWMIFIGAALFMTSDSLLAVDKFYFHFAFSGPLVMLTYLIAQYLIVEGVVKHTISDSGLYIPG